MKIYINMKEDYSSLTINEGFVKELKDYVKNVEWLSWNYINGKPFISIKDTSDWKSDTEKKRLNIFLCRIKSHYKKVKIFYRKSKDEKWKEFVPTIFSEKEMLEEEIKTNNKELDFALADAKKLEKYISFAQTEEDIAFLEGEMEACLEKLKENIDKQYMRTNIIQNIWEGN